MFWNSSWEALEITCPDASYKLDRPGSVGPSVSLQDAGDRRGISPADISWKSRFSLELVTFNGVPCVWCNGWDGPSFSSLWGESVKGSDVHRPGPDVGSQIPHVSFCQRCLIFGHPEVPKSKSSMKKFAFVAI